LYLLAVPLWSEDCGGAAIGVSNIGIFDPGRAHMLKVLGQAAQVRELAAWADAEFPPTSVVTDSPGLTPNEVHRMFYDRLMTESDKVAERAACRDNGHVSSPNGSA
jgi:hypothetical protein